MIITSEILKSKKACKEGIKEFELTFPDGIEVNEALTPWHQAIIIGKLGRWWGWMVEEGIIPFWSMSDWCLEGITLQRADLRYSILKRANLSNSDFTDSILWRAQLRRANFKNSILVGVNFTESDLSYANFENADLTCANFTRADLRHCNLKNAIIDRAIFNNNKTTY